jgi:F0F1-type ATP synthase beta subunit
VSAAALDDLDGVLVLSQAVATERIYSCVDALASRSRLLDPTIVGGHADVAARVRRALEAFTRLASQDPQHWSSEERRSVKLARKVRQ